MAAWIEMNEAAALVPDGSKMALGGAHCMSPLAFIHGPIKERLART